MMMALARLRDVRERLQHLGKRVADVDAVGGGEAVGDPEEPVEAHRVVDAQRAGMVEHGVERFAERLEVARDEAGRRERREAPVLARRVVIVGRRADAGAGHGQGAVRPGGRAVRRDADGEVEIEADAHAGGARPRLRLAELPVGKPLQPRVERDQLGLFLGEGADGIGAGMAVFVGPAVPRGAMALLRHGLRKRLEQGVQIERLAAVEHELLEIRVVLVVRGAARRCGRARRAPSS